jgi:hypothetical protein
MRPNLSVWWSDLYTNSYQQTKKPSGVEAKAPKIDTGSFRVALL